MRKALFFYFIIACALSSCVKAPEYSIIPAIKFVSVTSQYVTVNSLDTIILSFTDGDGDIAPNTAYPSIDTCVIPGKDSSVFYNNYYNILLFPSNLNFGCWIPNVFASPNLVPSGSYKALSGQIQIYTTIQSSVCLGGCSGGCSILDSVSYTIYLRDLAGHLSNPLQTPYIKTGCQ